MNVASKIFYNNSKGRLAFDKDAVIVSISEQPIFDEGNATGGSLNRVVSEGDKIQLEGLRKSRRTSSTHEVRPPIGTIR